MAKLASFLSISLFLVFFGFGTAIAAAQSTDAYTLGAGDQLHVTVFGEDDLTGNYTIDGQGFVSLPLIGHVHVGGMTASQSQEIITQKYAANYLVNPRVSVAVLNYRPFFILGQVKNPGSYPYMNGMTVLNAVALAGGYTDRGNPNNISVTHVNDAGKDQSIKEGDTVMPGDIIRVHQKLW